MYPNAATELRGDEVPERDGLIVPHEFNYGLTVQILLPLGNATRPSLKDAVSRATLRPRPWPSRFGTSLAPDRCAVFCLVCGAVAAHHVSVSSEPKVGGTAPRIAARVRGAAAALRSVFGSAS